MPQCKINPACHPQGVRKKRTFAEAALRYLKECQHKRSISRDKKPIKVLHPYIGRLTIDSIHMGTLQTYIEKRQDEGVKARTINYGLQVVRRILNLAATEWVDENNLTWLLAAPKIKLLPETDKAKPYPLNWDEQQKLIQVLPDYLKQMTLFVLHTGLRNSEVCNLQWEWEVQAPVPGGSVFLLPAESVKNGMDRILVLNEVARSIVEERRGKHATHVFCYRKKPLQSMLRKSWRRAREESGMPQLRVHDLRHTFGRRLRAVGVSFEDRQDLLGHKSSRITTHYSAAELDNLYVAVNRLSEVKGSSPALLLVRQNRSFNEACPSKSRQDEFINKCKLA